MAKYTRPDQVVRHYGPQPSTSKQSIPGDADFVDPYRSSNDVLGYEEAGPSTRPADYKNPPRIDTLSPASGTTAGSVVVTIVGRFLSGVTGVTFGGTAGTALTLVNDSTLRVTTPAKTAGAVNVVVTNAGGPTTKVNGFTYA